MQVRSDFQRGLGYGELLRLASIIYMNENNLEKLSIFAMNEAIPFHHKYKLLPNIIFHKDNIQDLLVNISRQKNPKFADLVVCAKNLLENISMNDFGMNLQTEKKLLADLNSLVENYIDLADKNHLPWISSIRQPGVSFRMDLDMMLSRDRILQNRDFFNEKFRQHSIDYEI